MAAGFNETEGSLAHKLMGAMQGANIPGADQRCLDRGTSSTSAFLTVYGPDDSEDDPQLLLDILEMPFGEEPIDSLQVLFDELVLLPTSDILNPFEEEIVVYPNPTGNLLYLDNKDNLKIHQIQIYNHLGILLKEINSVYPSNLKIDIEDLDAGLHFLEVTQEGKKRQAKFIKY